MVGKLSMNLSRNRFLGFCRNRSLGFCWPVFCSLMERQGGYCFLLASGGTLQLANIDPTIFYYLGVFSREKSLITVPIEVRRYFLIEKIFVIPTYTRCCEIHLIRNIFKSKDISDITIFK